MVKKKILILFLGLFSLTLAGVVLAASSAPANSLGEVADNVQSSYSSLAKLLTATSYLMGICFFIAGLYGLKTFKDNPAQNQIGKPIMMIGIGALLTFLPSLMSSGGATIFGSDAETSGTSGFTSLPDNA